MELMVALLMLTMSVVQVGSFGQIMCDDDDDDSDVDKGVIDIMDNMTTMTMPTTSRSEAVERTRSALKRRKKSSWVRR